MPEGLPLVEPIEQPEFSDACVCDTNPSTTDGPQEDCPQHGRPYGYWVKRSDEGWARVRELEGQISGLLTEDEKLAVEQAAGLWNTLTRVVGKGPTRDADLTELIIPIHLIQRYVMAQVAARAIPEQYRLLGELGAWESEDVAKPEFVAPPPPRRGDQILDEIASLSPGYAAMVEAYRATLTEEARRAHGKIPEV